MSVVSEKIVVNGIFEVKKGWSEKRVEELVWFVVIFLMINK